MFFLYVIVQSESLKGDDSYLNNFHSFGPEMIQTDRRRLWKFHPV
jgi:hypothetical protein